MDLFAGATVSRHVGMGVEVEESWHQSGVGVFQCLQGGFALRALHFSAASDPQDPAFAESDGHALL